MVHPKEYDIGQLKEAEIAPWIAGPYHGLWIQVASPFTIVVRGHEALRGARTLACRVHTRVKACRRSGLYHRVLDGETSPKQPPKEASKNFVNKIPPSLWRKVVRQYYHDELEIETPIARSNGS
jgi:hypothetical protein